MSEGSLPHGAQGAAASREVTTDGAAGPGASLGPSLGDAERRLLAFEGQWFQRPGSKEQSIRDTFGLNVTRYYQWVNSVIDDPVAMEYDPVLVKRLRRARDARTRTPAARRPARSR